PIEFTTISTLLWIPVSVFALLLHNALYYILRWTNEIHQVWTIDVLIKETNTPEFLLWFLLLSVIVSFVFSSLWVMFFMDKLRSLINFIRKKRKLAGLSENPSVWDELFLKNEAQVVEIGKI